MHSSPDRAAASRPRLRVRLFEPVDISFLIFLRIAFGAIVLWEVGRYFAHGWIDRYFVDPTVYFTYYGFGWVHPWPETGMHGHFFGLGFLGVCILSGLCYRIAATLFCLGFTYVFLLDQTRYLNHFYLISLLSFLLIFLPAHRAVSVDVLLRPKLRSDVTPRWTLWLLRVQIGIVYFYGGIAKLSHDWVHGEPMRTWLAQRTDFPLIGSLFQEEWMVQILVFGGMLLDLLIVPLLLWKRTRLLAFLVATAFHLLNARLFNIGIFPWFMLCATLLFFPPDFPRRILRSLGLKARGFDRAPLANAATVAGPLSPAQKATLLCLAVYVTVQILVPLRHFVYPGDVNWTEEGHHFSWHMMLRTKRAEAHFTITDPLSKRVWRVDLEQYLESRQRRKVAAHPDMILQFCHYLAGEKRREGYERVEVRALVTASLNGRKPQLLVDPEADLAKERRGFLPAAWIVPLTEPLPQRSPSSQEEESGARDD